MRKTPSEEALKNFYEAIKPALVRIAKENKAKKEAKNTVRQP